MRYRLCLLMLLASLCGCGPSLTQQELGTVEFELPKIAGAEEPYRMPQLGPPLERSQKSLLQDLP